MNEEEAVQVLQSKGFAAKYKESQSYIVGGTRCREEELFTFYESKFQIKAINGKWAVEVPGPGQFDTKQEMDSLSDAVEFVCKYYVDQGWIEKSA